MTKLAELIAKYEGFGKEDTVPTRNHNPGDLRHGPHAHHLEDSPNGIGIYETDEEGWADLERQLELYAKRGLTLKQAVYCFAPPTENDSEHYLNFVCAELGVPSNTLVAKALLC